MKLDTLRIPCTDVDAASDYYETRLGLEKIFGSAEEGFVGFKIDNVQIIIEQEAPGEFEANRYLGFSLQVDDINEFYLTRSQNGVVFTNEPEQQDWGGWMTHVVDPSNNTFSIIQLS